MSAEILKMIETVDPSDTAKLDEIDARVFNYVADFDYTPTIQCPYQYTRSRDALKAIRPEGWQLKMNILPDRALYQIKHLKSGDLMATELPTEELAELHSIIQAIEHERSTAQKGEGNGD